MYVIQAYSLDEAYSDAIAAFTLIPSSTITKESRVGPVLEIDQPVTTTYENPRRRVLMNPVRNANPFLHLFESIWMLDGRRDVSFMTQFSKTFAEFSDDGQVFNAAYGHRWFHHFRRKSTNSLHEEIDQIQYAITELRTNPDSRRIVTQIWDGSHDIGLDSKDLPCNTSIMWLVRNGTLDMSVTNRSNDAIWGCYGANAVHFSMLHELVALAAGLKVGRYFQFSNSLHIYKDRPDVKRILEAGVPPRKSSFNWDNATHHSLLNGDESYEDFKADCHKFTNHFEQELGNDIFLTSFFNKTLVPMQRAFRYYKRKKYNRAVHESLYIRDDAWCYATHEWLMRISEKNR